MKRVFGIFEAVFDAAYLLAALLLGVFLLAAGETVASLMAFVLVSGDACHLLPRICVIATGQEERFRPALGRGKQIASMTMTLFYLLLWQLAAHSAAPAGPLWTGVVYLLAALRLALCLLPQNRWQERYPPLSWSIIRNLPFFLLGMLVAWRLFLSRGALDGLSWAWLAVLLSFLFYLPVVLLSSRYPKAGMLMLPKTCMYLWLLAMCLPAGRGLAVNWEGIVTGAACFAVVAAFRLFVVKYKHYFSVRVRPVFLTAGLACCAAAAFAAPMALSAALAAAGFSALWSAGAHKEQARRADKADPARGRG